MKKTLLITIVILVLSAFSTISAQAEEKILSSGIIPTTTFQISNVEQLKKLTDGNYYVEGNYDVVAAVPFRVEIEDSSFINKFGKEAAGYFEFDLGAVCTVTGYKIYNYKYPDQYSMAKSWKIMVSEDGENFTEVNYIKNGVYSNQTYMKFFPLNFKEPVKARYVRLAILSVHVGGTKDSSEVIRLYEFEILGDGEPVKTPPEKKMSVSGDILRQAAVDAAYQAAAVEWSPEADMDTHNYRSDGTYSITFKFYKGFKYHGPPYDRMIKSSLEMFESVIEDGIYTGGTDSETALAMDCGSYVFNAIGRVSSIATLAPLDCFDNVEKMYPLGDLSVKIEDAGNTERILARYTKEQVFEAYAQADKGDIVVTYPENNHVRIITGDVHVERTADGKIDGDKSYIITCESGSKNVKYFYKNANGEINTIFANSPTAVQNNPQNEFLYGTTINVDEKYTFSDLYDSEYVALTLAAYHTGETEVPNIVLKTSVEPETLAGTGLTGRIDSNYRLFELVYSVTDEKGSEIYTESFYGERRFSYPMSTIAENLNRTIGELANGSYKLKITAKTGPITTIGGGLTETEVLNMSFTVPAVKIVEETTVAVTTAVPSTSASTASASLTSVTKTEATSSEPTTQASSESGSNTFLIIVLIVMLSILIVVIVLITLKFRGERK